MSLRTTSRQTTDYLVIGSGIAGLSAALEAAELGTVTVITKSSADECNTMYAQGGVACVIAEGDSFEAHVEDTLKAGAGLCETETVRAIVSAGPARIRHLMEIGVHFTTRGEMGESEAKPGEQPYDLGKEGGHSQRRVLHSGDITGQELVRVLLDRCRENERITLLENHLAVDLISTRHMDWQGENCCMGAYVMDRDNHSIYTMLSRYTILASGGCGKVYVYTSNPDVASGDGIAMGYRAYAEIRNMEFYQFHPTILYHPAAKSFLISEAVRGEGAVLKVRRRGQYCEFMDDYSELGSLAPRDVVARAIDNELKRTGEECAYLDIRHKDEAFLRTRFPNIFATCERFGINMARDFIPVVPAAHYCCGGVATDVNGFTGVKNLYAVGEVGCTGLHGANRLASNSLLEALVVSHNAVQHTRTVPSAVPVEHFSFDDIPDWSFGNAVDSDEHIVIAHNWDEIRRFMWDYVGIVRTVKRLERAKNRIRLLRREIEMYYWDFLPTPDLIELRNLASVAEMIIDSAMARRESRGLHYNQSYPVNNEPPGVDTVLRRPSKAIIWSEGHRE